MAKIIFVLGGARSGKSEYAEHILAADKNSAKGYIATSRIWDDEVRHRVKLHRERRPKEWRTFEYPETDPEILINIFSQAQVFLFDCVTMYVNNIIMDGIELAHAKEKDVISESSLDGLLHDLDARMNAVLSSLQNKDITVIFVSNELGLGIVPDNPISRIYRDMVGLANQRLAAVASEMYFVICGIPVCLKRGE